MTTPDTLRQLQAEHRSELAESERLHPGLVMPWENPAWATIAAAAPTHLTDLITAKEREAKVRELHKPRSTPHGDACDHCCLPHPCPTIRILDGNE